MRYLSLKTAGVRKGFLSLTFCSILSCVIMMYTIYNYGVDNVDVYYTSGTIDRVMFHKINTRIYMLASYFSELEREIYILTESEHYDNTSDLYCVLCKNLLSLYDNCKSSAVKSMHWTHHGRDMPLKPSLFICDIPNDVNMEEYTTSTLKAETGEYGHLFVTKSIDRYEDKCRITMCAGPQFGLDKTPYNIAEWIEFHRLMGVSRFRIYMTDTESVSEHYHSILKMYVKQGVVDLFYWEFVPRTFYYSQAALINHCIWYSKSDSDFISYNDIDEFFIPTGKKNLNDALESYFKDDNISEIRFTNWYYDASCSLNDNVNMMLSSKYIRQREPPSYHNCERTKYIARANKILVANVHCIHEFIGKHSTVVLPPDVGYLAHFTCCLFQTKDCNPENDPKRQIHDGLETYGKLIDDRVKAIVSSVLDSDIKRE